MTGIIVYWLRLFRSRAYPVRLVKITLDNFRRWSSPALPELWAGSNARHSSSVVSYDCAWPRLWLDWYSAKPNWSPPRKYKHLTLSNRISPSAPHHLRTCHLTERIPSHWEENIISFHQARYRLWKLWALSMLSALFLTQVNLFILVIGLHFVLLLYYSIVQYISLHR